MVIIGVPYMHVVRARMGFSFDRHSMNLTSRAHYNQSDRYIDMLF